MKSVDYVTIRKKYVTIAGYRFLYLA